MSNEHSAKEGKGQPQETEAISERVLKNFLRTWNRPGAEALHNVCMAERLERFCEGTSGQPQEFHTLVFIDKEGNINSTVTTVVDLEQRASTEAETGQPFSEYLTQIDQRREQAQAAQSEIDQLRTETRQLISLLFAA